MNSKAKREPRQAGCQAARAPGAGTEIEDRTEGGTRGLYEAEVRPVLDARPSMWGPGERWCGYEAFMRAAGLVQSRSFHVNTENWLTGQRTEGGSPGPAMAGELVSIRLCLR